MGLFYGGLITFAAMMLASPFLVVAGQDSIPEAFTPEWGAMSFEIWQAIFSAPFLGGTMLLAAFFLYERGDPLISDLIRRKENTSRKLVSSDLPKDGITIKIRQTGFEELWDAGIIIKGIGLVGGIILMLSVWQLFAFFLTYDVAEETIVFVSGQAISFLIALIVIGAAMLSASLLIFNRSEF